MVKPSKVLIFALINALGFFSVAVCYTLGVTGNFIDVQAADFDIEYFKQWFLAGTMLTWLICAAFSTAYFFVRGPLRLVFLWIPVVVPMGYGLSIIFLYGAA